MQIFRTITVVRDEEGKVKIAQFGSCWEEDNPNCVNEQISIWRSGRAGGRDDAWKAQYGHCCQTSRRRYFGEGEHDLLLFENGLFKMAFHQGSC